MMDAVQLFKALGDETRLRILHLLCHKELCVCQIVEVLGIGQSKASRHLAHLRNAGLVSDRREGLWMYYSLTEVDGELHQRLVEWLSRAKDEVPVGTADMDALGNLGECGNLYPDRESNKQGEPCEGAAVIGS